MKMFEASNLEPEPLLAMQTRYDLIVNKRNPTFSERLKAIRNAAAIL